MELTTIACPACGAPIHFAENALVVLCAYCHSQVARTPEGITEGSEHALQALKAAQYEQADLYFVEVLKQDPGQRLGWLYRAVAAGLNPYGSLADALGFLHASHFSTEEAAKALASLTSASSLLFDQCLERYPALAAQAPQLADVVLEGALRSTNAGHQKRIAQTYTHLAETKWQAGQVEKAVFYMQQALKLDEAQRPHNLWLLELAQKPLGIEEPEGPAGHPV